MRSKRYVSLLLALVCVLSCAFTFAGCGGSKEEKPKTQRRTDVFSGTSLKVPGDMTYSQGMVLDEKNIYQVYRTDYTLVMTEEGEEFDRLEGWYYEYYGGGGYVVYEDYDMGMPEDETEEGKTEGKETEPSEGYDDTWEGVEEPVETYPSEDWDDWDWENWEDFERPVGEYLHSDDDEFALILAKNWYLDYLSIPKVVTIPLDGSDPKTTALDMTGYPYYNSYSLENGEIKVIIVDYNYDEERDTYENTYTQQTYSLETGKLVSEDTADLQKIVADYLGQTRDNTFVNNYFWMPDGWISVATDTNIVVLDGSLKPVAKTDFSGWVYSSYSSKDDTVFLISTDMGGNKLMRYTVSGGFSNVDSIESKTLDYMYSLCGYSDDRLYFQESTGIAYIDLKTGEKKPFVDFINCDIDYSTISQIYVMDNDRLVISSYIWEQAAGTSRMTAEIYNRIPDEEMPEEIIITLGMANSDYRMMRGVLAFNKKNTGVRVSSKTYEEFNNEDNQWQGSYQQFAKDLSTGNVPDIILLNQSMPVETLIRNSIFTDLSKYLDDPEDGLDRSKFYGNILDASKVNGKLYTIIPMFNLVSLAGKTKNVGTGDSWTLADMMQLVKSMPEGTELFFGDSRDSILSYFLTYSLGTFVDWDTGRTYFDTPEFVDFIKYLATVRTKDYWTEYYESMGDDYVYDPETEAKVSETYELRFFRDQSMLMQANIGNAYALLNIMNSLATNDINCIGYPTASEGKSGTLVMPQLEIAIAQRSQVKKYAWSFLKSLLEDDALYSESYGFSINRKINEEAIDNEQEYWIRYDKYASYDGGLTEEDIEWYRSMGYSEEYIEYLKNTRRTMNDDVKAMLKEMILHVNAVSRTDSDLVAIVNEELSSFFGGTRSAEEIARNIAGRVRTYISENS